MEDFVNENESIYIEGHWCKKRYTHMIVKDSVISNNKLEVLRKLIGKLPKKSSDNIFYDYMGQYGPEDASVIIMVGDYNYMLWYDDTTSPYYELYEFIKSISPMPIVPTFYGAESVVSRSTEQPIKISK